MKNRYCTNEMGDEIVLKDQRIREGFHAKGVSIGGWGVSTNKGLHAGSKTLVSSTALASSIPALMVVDFVGNATNTKELTGDYWMNKILGGKDGAPGGGQPGYPSFNFMFEPIEFEPVMLDFMALYDEIRTKNEGLIKQYSAESAEEAKVLSRDFTATNLQNFETAMEVIQPGYKGLMSKTQSVVNDWLFGRVPEDVQNQLMIQASSRANQNGLGAGGFARNLLTRDFGQTSMQLQEAGVGQAQQLVNSARETSRSLIADPSQLYGMNFQAKVNSNILQPGQYLSSHLQQATFNSGGQLQADSANQQMQAQMAIAQYQDELNKYAASQQQKVSEQNTGIFGKYFGNEIGSILDPVADIAVPLVATVYSGGNVGAGAAAGAAWGGLQAKYRGGDVGQGALMGGVTGGITAYSFGKPATAWWQGRQLAADPLASESAYTAYMQHSGGWSK